MLIFLYGEDSYRRRQRQKDIISQYRLKHGNLDIERFDSDNSNWLESFSDFAKNRFLFGSIKLAILDEPEIKKLNAEKLKFFKKILKSNLKEESLVVLLSLSSKPKEFVFLVKKPTIVEKFDQFSKEKEKNKIFSFIKKEAALREFEISEKNIFSLIENFGADTWALVTELDKINFSQEFPVYHQFKKLEYFKLTDSLKKSRDKKERLIALELLLSGLKEEPARIFNNLAYGNFFYLSCGDWYKKLADYDVFIKTGKMDYKEALLDFIIS
ncbi:MAG: hypothetical protein KY053_01600 [Candidatus Liptonbacteria bacterium]|nr:hypothetical protein [Candidatus Liptonbacteria bacterium]